jgi:transposase-like protein
MPAVPWQRCQCHLQRKAMAYVPKVQVRKEGASDIRDIFNAPLYGGTKLTEKCCLTNLNLYT